ncbi:MAG: hypothetical protein M3Q76_13510 [Acidobacteriota bacterium]|nr:hypothetical protein [Acidobacteriota bacterium]
MSIKRGSCTVKIYEERKPAGRYYRVIFHIGGKRHRVNFKTLQKAVEHAEQKAAEMSRGDADALQLTGRDRLIYARATNALSGFNVAVDTAAEEYKAARELMKGVGLIDAATFYQLHHGEQLTRKSVADAVDEMIAKIQRNLVGGLQLAQLRYRLGALKNAFQCDLNALTPDDLARFFEALQLGPRSHNNFLRAARSFFAYAQKHGWLPKESDLLARVEKRREKSAPVEIFSPAEMAALLASAPPELRPCLALGAFAGLRSEEILRLEWSDVDRRPGFVEIAADKAKTPTRRLVPIADNLALWLALAPREHSRIWRHSKPWFFESIRRAATAAKLCWRQNGLRHSFITYRLAEIHDVNRVAIEAGNSPKMIFEHYRELATPDEGKNWFAIQPNEPVNVVPMHANR